MKHEPETRMIPGSMAAIGGLGQIDGGHIEGTAPQSRFYTSGGKRIFDIFLVIAASPILLPVILFLGLMVMRDGGMPFFGHKRVGRNGKIFRCWKIRSMVPDAEARLVRHLADNPEARVEWEANFKLEDDPRITRLGRFLRASSLDELPQLWNILTGEMSCVGPRPVTATELELYGPAASDYRRMRPGLTGLWQVSGRNDISYAERVELDVLYARETSMLGDIGIMAKTVGAVVNRTGR